jgi:competence protein ComEC
MTLALYLPVSSFSRGVNHDQSRITFLDVGQGNATLLELPGNNNILVDGGGSSSPGFDPGEQIIAPFLWHQAIRRLKTVVISHNHQDHYNGLEFIIRNFRPAEVWINGAVEESREYLDMLRAAEEVGAVVRVPDMGTVLAAAGAAKLTCISDLHQRLDPDLPVNSRSLVLRLAVGERKIILPGDIMADDGRRLIAQGIDLRSDVLLAPHHGSQYSAGYDLVREGSPAWLVVSASPFKAEYFPNPAFAQWCRQRQTSVINTAITGAVTFTIEASGKLSRQAISGKGAKEGRAGGV